MDYIHDTFQINITAKDGVNYTLPIRTTYKVLEAGINKIIYLFISVNTEGKEGSVIDSMAFKYNLSTKEYDALSDLEGLQILLYDDVIKKLEETKGMLWLIN